MKELILHIGTHKTGTSSIQFYLAKNRDALEKQGWCYPDVNVKYPYVGINRNGHFIQRQTLKTSNPSEYSDIDVDYCAKAEPIFRKAIEGHERVLLSDETFWNSGSRIDSYWDECAKVLHNYGFEKVTIIVYLRRQDLLVQSLYKQRIKEDTDNTSTLQSFLSKRSITCLLHYAATIERIEQAFGKGCVIVRVYERDSLYENDVVQDFYHTLDIDAGEDKGFIRADKQKNESLHGNFTQMRRAMNLSPSIKRSNDFTFPILLKANAASTEHPGDLLMSYEQAMTLLEKHAKGNARIARDYLGRADGVLFSMPDPNNYDAYTFDAESMLNDTILLFTEFVVRNRKRINKLEEQNAHLAERLEKSEAKAIKLEKRLEHLRHPFSALMGKK